MIVKMNKFTFLIYHKDYETFLEKLRDLGVVHVEVRQSGEMDESVQPIMQKYVAYKNLLKEMASYAAQCPCTDIRALDTTSIEKVNAEYDMRCEQIQAQVAELSLLDKEMKAFDPWGGFEWASWMLCRRMDGRYSSFHARREILMRHGWTTTMRLSSVRGTGSVILSQSTNSW